MGNYLYGEVLLPNINAIWTDKKTYPYAYIRSTISTDSGFPALAMLYITTMPLYFDDSTNYGSYRARSAGDVIKYSFNINNGSVWKYEETISCAVDEEIFTNFTTSRGWANTDILNSDGTLYLAASDPIPVGTAFPADLDPWSWEIGRLVGQAVRRLRGKAKWETLFEGTVTTAYYSATGSILPDSGYRKILINSLQDGYLWDGQYVRVTVDGTTKQYIVKHIGVGEYSHSITYAGNLAVAYVDAEDTGENWLILCVLTGGADYFYTKEAGTHDVKLERGGEPGWTQ